MEVEIENKNKKRAKIVKVRVNYNELNQLRVLSKIYEKSMAGILRESTLPLRSLQKEIYTVYLITMRLALRSSSIQGRCHQEDSEPSVRYGDQSRVRGEHDIHTKGEADTLPKLTQLL